MSKPDFEDPGETDASPPVGANQWIMNSINQLGTRLDGVQNHLSKQIGEAETRVSDSIKGVDKRLVGIEARLSKVETRIWLAIGGVAMFGALVGTVWGLIDFDFVVSIQPRAAP